MIDEIDYFPKRDKYKKKKPVDEGWGELKKSKTAQGKKGRKEDPLSSKPGGKPSKDKNPSS